MILEMNFPSFGITKIKNKYTSCLIVYDENPIYRDEEFVDYIKKVMIKIGKITSFTSMAIIFANRGEFLLDWHSMEFELKSQLMFFEDKKLTHTLYMEDLLSEFAKLRKT